MSRLRNSTIVALVALPITLAVAIAVGFRRLIADYNDNDFGNIQYDEWDVDDFDDRFDDTFGYYDAESAHPWDGPYYDDSPEWVND